MEHLHDVVGVEVGAGTGAKADDGTSEAVRTELALQVGRAVRWRESVEFMLAAGVRTFVEIGPGTALTSLVKAAAKDLKLKLTLHNFNTIDSIRGGR